MKGVSKSGPPQVMTYSELASVRGITQRSAEQLVRRNGWRRLPGNDGRTRVEVPSCALLTPLQHVAPTPATEAILRDVAQIERRYMKALADLAIERRKRIAAEDHLAFWRQQAARLRNRPQRY